ncbi:MAG: MxaL protein [Gammaproteobacteria bacterium]
MRAWRYLRARRLEWLVLTGLLLALTFILPSIELARPHFRYLAVFDITQSMNAADTADSSTRLTFAKQALAAALGELPCGAELGLAIFAGHRVFMLFTPVEVCAHFGEIGAMIRAIDWRMAWEARSEIAKGLFEAITVARKLGQGTRVLFVSDGHEAPPVNLQFRTRFQGEPGAVKGLIIGVGGPAPTPIPKLDSEDKISGYWRADEVQQVDTFSLGRQYTSVEKEAMVGVDMHDTERRIRTGTEHLTYLHETYLRELAAEAGLGYISLRDPALLARQLTAPELAEPRRQETDVRWLFALAALIAFCARYILRRGDGRTVLRRRRERG